MTVLTIKTPSRDKLAPLRMIVESPDESAAEGDDVEGDSKCWGHLGLRFVGNPKSSWYPVSSEEADRVRRNLKRGEDVSEWIVVETMNNHTLAFRPKELQRIWLLDETCDAPEDTFDRQAPWHDWEGLPAKLYLAMADWADRDSSDKRKRKKAYSKAVEKMAISMIKRAGLANRPDEVRAALRHTTVHFTDGSTTQYEVDPEDLLELAELDEEPGTQIVEISASQNDFESFYPTNALIMIDIPTIELNAVRLNTWGPNYFAG